MKTTWKKVEESLSDPHAHPEMRDRQSFWSDFTARAHLRPQHHPEPVRVPLIWKWSVATACATLLAAVVGFQFLDNRPIERKNPVKLLDVLAEHSAVIVMNDEPSHATVVWVTDMKIDALNEETP